VDQVILVFGKFAIGVDDFPQVFQNSAFFHHVSMTHNYEMNYDKPHPAVMSLREKR
jgi:hypothetical protein